MKIYPNPSNSYCDVSLLSQLDDNMKVEIISTIGQTIFSEDYIVKTGINKINLNLEQFSSALYLFRITTSSGKYFDTKQLIIND